MARDVSPAPPPTRAELEAAPGPLVVEFGASWCGYCRAFAPDLEAVLRDFPQVAHLKVEDGPGQPLGRSFRVKLWPTLVLWRDGHMRARLVRPSAEEVRAGLVDLTSSTTSEPG